MWNHSISIFCQAAQHHVALSERLTIKAVLIMKRNQKEASLEPIRYPVVHLKLATPEGAIQLITQNK